jgi:adenosylmethionine-8-amino-7-oxononanoate aminotransferase
MKTATPPLPVVATDGVRLRLADGRELIDGIASWWTACHGHNHPHIIAAMRRQLDVMPHVMFGGLGHEPAFTLARRLSAILPAGLSHVFFSDSGSVAVEVAMKMALQYWRNLGVANRQRFVGFRQGYHGDTMGAMSVSDQAAGLHAAMRGAIPEQIIVDLPESAAALAVFDALLAQRAGEIAAVIVEPLVQGAGGLKMHDASVLAAIRAGAARHGILFIADEIFTGFARTGRLFACQEAGIAPDIICLSKALTGGAVGLAATVANERVYGAFLGDSAATALMHGPTYMANPLACAAANASLDLFEREPRLRQVARIEAHLKVALEPCRDIPGVKDVRVKGAIGVVQLSPQVNPLRDLDWLRRRFVAEGVWLRPFGDVVYTTPPLVIGEDDLAKLTSAINTVVRAWSQLARA